MTIFITVHMFWEDHKILRNLHRRFDRYYIGKDKFKVEISKNFVAFSEYMNFNKTTETSFTKLMFRESFWGADMYRLIILKKSFFFNNLRILSNHLTNFLNSSNAR